MRVIFCYIHGSLCDYPLKDLGAVEISSDEEGGPPASLTSGTNALNMQIIYKALEEIKKSLDMYLTRWIFLMLLMRVVEKKKHGFLLYIQKFIIATTSYIDIILDSASYFCTGNVECMKLYI